MDNQILINDSLAGYHYGKSIVEIVKETNRLINMEWDKRPKFSLKKSLHLNPNLIRRYV